MVAGEVRLTLDGIDDEDLSLRSWGRGELDVRGEGRTAEAYDTCGADAVDDLLGLEGALLDEGRGAVDALFPLLLFALCDGDDDGGALVAARIEEAVDLRDLACDGGVDVGRYEARRLGDDSTYLDEVALLDGRGGRCADVLADGYDDLTRQWELLDGALS